MCMPVRFFSLQNMLLNWGHVVIGLGLVVFNVMGFTFSPEWQQYRHYREYILPTFAPQCNLTDYYTDIHGCALSSRRMICEKIVLTRYHRSNCIVWTPTFSHDHNSTAHHPLPDCQYSFELADAFREKNTVELEHDLDVFQFRVTQHQCTFQFSSTHNNIRNRLQGGSSFDIFAYTAHAMARCRTVDHFNDTYTVSCSAPVATKVNSSEHACINLSVLLEHEHYDTYSLALQMWAVEYSSVRHTLLDNATFCTVTGPLIKQGPSVPPVGVAVNRPQYFSGKWILQSMPTKHSITYCAKFNSSFLEFSRQDLGSSRHYSFWNAFRGCFQDVADYKRAYNYEIPDDGTPQIARSENVSQEFEFRASLSSTGETRSMYVGGSSRALKLPTYEALGKLVNDKEQNFVFSGSSHMRYTTYGLLEMLYGPETIRLMNRKDASIRHEHFLFEFHPFANQMAMFVRTVCGNSSFSSASLTLILQTGDWDLTSGPSNVLDDPSAGAALLQVITGILDGSYPCHPVRHVVFLTAMPYPICYSDSESSCAADRCFRTNPMTAATNHYFVEHLLNVTVASSKRFSIVDAFDIGVPRVALNQNFDVACRNHFLCAVGSPLGTEMVYTPTGLALVQTLLQALTFDDAGNYS
jgi:hypothetical protein